MLKKILLVVAVLGVVFVLAVVRQPDAFSVTRSATFSVPPSKLYSQINNLHNWNAWSPWAKLDPNAKNTFEGPAAGVGASLAWAGNKNVGEGKMTITESQPNELVRMRLDFVKPFASTSTTEFRITPDGNKTGVQWTMSGPNNFIGKAISLFMNCDKMIGGQFDQGLANLKSVVEGPAKP